MKIHFTVRAASYKVYSIVTIAFGISSFAFGQQSKYPTTDIESYYDVNFTKAERDSFFSGLQEYQKSIQAIHQYKLDNAIGMSLIFDPIPVGFQLEISQRPIDWGLPKEVKLPENRNELAFFPVYKLAPLIKAT